MALQRSGQRRVFKIGTNAASKAMIDFDRHVDFLLHFPTGWQAADIEVYSRDHNSQEWCLVKTAAGEDVRISVPAGPIAHQLPSAVFASHEIQLRQTVPANATVDVEVHVKS